MRLRRIAVTAGVTVAMLLQPIALANAAEPPAGQPPPTYKPPLRGAPGGRVGGASRSALRSATPLPVIELLAPADHAGITATPAPILYYFASRPVSWPTEFTISAPGQPAPVLEIRVPSAPAAGFYKLPLSAYRVRLQPGIAYTWSVSAVIDPHAWSHNIVASATILYDPAAPAGAASAAQLAAAGLWYDAVAAAADVESPDRHGTLDALIRDVGLVEATRYEAAARTAARQ